MIKRPYGPCRWRRSPQNATSTDCWRRGIHQRNDLRSDGIFISAIAERVAVTIERRGAAQMRVEHLRPFREESLLDEIDHPVCTENLSSGVVVVKSAKDGV